MTKQTFESYTDACLAIGISRSWYAQIRHKKVTPNIVMGLRIYDVTGEQYGILAGLSKDAIEDIRKNVDGA